MDQNARHQAGTSVAARSRRPRMGSQDGKYMTTGSMDPQFSKIGSNYVLPMLTIDWDWLTSKNNVDPTFGYLVRLSCFSSTSMYWHVLTCIDCKRMKRCSINCHCVSCSSNQILTPLFCAEGFGNSTRGTRQCEPALMWEWWYPAGVCCLGNLIKA